MRSDPIWSKAAAVCFLVILVSCASSTRTKVLRIFFDGVPETENRQEEPAGITPPEENRPVPVKTAPAIVMVSRHRDYADKNCARCHDRASANFLAADKKTFCFLCHKKEDYDAEYVHGPVAVGACLSCHVPHESKYRKLLQTESQDLCMKCHSTENMPASLIHIQNQAVGCTDCHVPHRSNNRFFLKQPAL
jgi:predicted CXXCH cytochrome family protein